MALLSGGCVVSAFWLEGLGVFWFVWVVAV